MIIEAKSSQLNIEMVDLMTARKQSSDNHIESIIQSAPNSTIKTYVHHIDGSSYFIKHYQTNSQLAFEEMCNYQRLKTADFVPNLIYGFYSPDQSSAIFSYEFVEGINMHEQFEINRQHEPKFSLATEAIRQFYKMGDMYDMPRETFDPWPIRSPIRAGFLNEDKEKTFLEDYETVFIMNAQSLKEFPGFYFDRNPRNVINSNGRVCQVDFNAIEYSSPLFDLAKFLRNGVNTGIPTTTLLETRSDYVEISKSLNAFTSEEEMDLLITAYSFQEPGDFDNQKFERFLLYFKFAAMHTHIFYLTKYQNMIRNNIGDTNVLKTRSTYHYGMLLDLSDELGEFGFKLDSVMQHIEGFMRE